MIGDPSKAKAELNWFAKTNFDDLVRIMVKEDLGRWRRWLNGERFPCDAPNYASEARILTRGCKS